MGKMGVSEKNTGIYNQFSEGNPILQIYTTKAELLTM
jgi:hypothetical protein